MALLLLSGCVSESGKPEESSDDDARLARSEVERGPVRVTVEVEPARARLSDEPVLTLTIRSEAGVTVHKPPFGESLGDFIIRDFHEPLPQMEGDREVLRQIYTLEPTRTGSLTVWPISVSFTDTRPDGDGRQHTVETEGVTIEVSSVVGSDVPSLDELRPMAPPVELPRTAGTGIWLLPMVLVALTVAGALIWWRRKRRRREEIVRQLSPRELAWLELQRLLESNLAEEDVKRFYLELTAVVRRYIERSTGVRAPEQTTEEFLIQISRDATYPVEESQRLKSFLESADLVKFAAYRPRGEDIEESFRRAKRFLALETTEVAA